MREDKTIFSTFLTFKNFKKNIYQNNLYFVINNPVY